MLTLLVFKKDADTIIHVSHVHLEEAGLEELRYVEEGIGSQKSHLSVSKLTYPVLPERHMRVQLLALHHHCQQAVQRHASKVPIGNNSKD